MIKKLFLCLFILVFYSKSYCEQDINQSDKFLLKMDITSMLQGNYGIHPMLTSAPSRLRLNLNTTAINRKLFFIARFSTAGGQTTASGNSEYLPINDIATDKSINNERGRANVLLDKAQFLWFISENCEFSVGVLDVKDFGSKGRGFDHSEVMLNEENGFVSAHFTRNAGLNFLAERDYPTVPAFSFNYSPSEWVNLKFILTFLDIEEHIFFTNSWGIESTFYTNFFGKRGSYRAIIGFADTHYSYTHHIAPSVGLEMEQEVLNKIYIFGRYGVSENHKVSRMFSDVFQHYNMGMSFVIDGKNPAAANYYLGMGVSQVFMFDSGHETAAELFLRCKFIDNITITPDFQFIINPHGYTEDDKRFLFIWGVRASLKL